MAYYYKKIGAGAPKTMEEDGRRKENQTPHTV